MPDIDSLLDAEISATSGDMTEWTGNLGGSEITLVSSPIRPVDIEIVERRFPKFSTEGGMAGMIAMIVLKARDEHGKQVFKRVHEEKLKRLGTTKIGEIFAALFGDSVEEMNDPDGEKHEARVGN